MMLNSANGYLLLVAGSLGAAFTASLDATEMDWPWYLLAVVVAATGVVIVKTAAGRDALAEHVLQGNRLLLEQALDNIIVNLDEVNTGKAEIPPHEMRFEIDRLFRVDLMAFVDARESMKHLYSLQDYADVMSAFAAGERYINRIWSASADGYVDEISLYLERAQAQFIEAKNVLDAVQQKHTLAA